MERKGIVFVSRMVSIASVASSTAVELSASDDMYACTAQKS
jgi:hypothetical protein